MSGLLHSLPTGDDSHTFSDESGKTQVYVRSFLDKTGKQQISNEEGTSPVWSRNGRELFFHNTNNQLMVAAYTVKGDLLLADKPRLSSEKKLAIAPTTRGYDVAPDGRRLVAILPVDGPEEQTGQHHVIFLLNFFDELRRRVPTG
jgi:Tol biopolymer transport system component